MDKELVYNKIIKKKKCTIASITSYEASSTFFKGFKLVCSSLFFLCTMGYFINLIYWLNGKYSFTQVSEEKRERII